MSPTDFFTTMIHSISLAFSLTFVYSFIPLFMMHRSRLAQTVVQATMLGLFAILDMAISGPISPGFYLDGRNVMIALSSAFGGPVAAAVTGALVCLYRIGMGGAGIWPAMAAALTTALLGLVFYYKWRHYSPPTKLMLLALLGIVSAAQALIWTAVLGGAIGAQLAIAVAPALLVFFPVGMLLIGMLLLYQEHYLKTHQARAQEHHLLRTLIDHMPDYIFIKDAQLRFITSNKAHAYAVNMSSVDRMIGKTAAELFPTNLAVDFEADDQWVLKTGAELVNAERLTTDARGNPRWVLTTKVPFRDQEGKIAGLVGISRDITERKQAEEEKAQQAALAQQEKERQQAEAVLREAYVELEIRVQERMADIERVNQELAHEVVERIVAEKSLIEERRLLHILMDNIPDSIYFKDTDSRFTRINRAQARVLGVADPQEALGKTDADFQDPELAKGFLAEEARIITSGQPVVNREEFNPTPDDNPRWFSATKVPIKDADGQVTGLVGVSRDITESKQAEQQALELTLHKEKIQLLADFIRDASHDLKTPLTVIHSSLYLLQHSSDPKRQKHHALNIEQQLMRLEELIDDLLMSVKLDSGDTFVFERLDLNRMVRQVYDSLFSAAEQQGLKLELQVDSEIPLIRADEEKLYRALRNLVENAIHYTPEGGIITIRTSMSGNQAIFEVQDTGIGMSEEDQARVFERFYRADKARSTQTGGSGLGLPITQKIVEAHSGVIEVESTVGQGSLFRVLLPLS